MIKKTYNLNKRKITIIYNNESFKKLNFNQGFLYCPLYDRNKEHIRGKKSKLVAKIGGEINAN